MWKEEKLKKKGYNMNWEKVMTNLTDKWKVINSKHYNFVAEDCLVIKEI